jgi:hypothetical protein
VALAVFEDCRAASERNRHLGYDPEHEQEAACALLRCVFGQPFQPVVLKLDSLLRWNGGAIGHLARVIYAEQRFSELPVLGDALEEAGCDDPVVLAHCRDAGVHIRGCWVIDQILNRS